MNTTVEEELEDKLLSGRKEKTLPQQLGTLTPEIVKKLIDEPNCNEYALDLHSRWLTKIDCLDVVPKLRCLDLSFNFLTSVEGLQHCPELRELKLYSNKISDARGVGRCRKLEVLYLTYNSLTVLPPDIQQLNKLKTLRVDRNQLRQLGNASLFSPLRELTFLDASSNCLLSTRGVEPLIHLEELVLDHNEITDLSGLGKCASLRELNLGYNHLSDLAGLKGLRQLQVLWLQGNHLCSMISLPLLPGLLELDISGNRLTTLEGLSAGAPQLDLLNASGNRMEDLLSMMREMEPLKDLRELSVAGSPCTLEESLFDWWFPMVRKLSTLTRLDDNEVAAEHRYGDEDFIKALIAGGGQPGTGDRPSTAGLRVRTPSSKGRPGSATQSSRPTSALSRLSTAHIRALDKTPLPVLKPPNSRTGITQKLEPLEDIEAIAAAFRMKCHTVRRELAHAVLSRASTPEVTPLSFSGPLRNKVSKGFGGTLSKSEPTLPSPPKANRSKISGPQKADWPEEKSRRGSRKLSKALHFSDTFHAVPPAPPDKLQLNGKLEDRDFFQNEDNQPPLSSEKRARGSEPRSFDVKADEAFALDDPQSLFLTQRIRPLSSQNGKTSPASWMDKLLQDHDQSSSDDQDESEFAFLKKTKSSPQQHVAQSPKENINQGQAPLDVPLISPKYQSEKTAEKQQAPTIMQKKGVGGLRKFKIPSQAKNHIDKQLEQNQNKEV